MSEPLGWADPLPHRPRRVLVAGTSGSGKTTLAAALAERLELPRHELDALFHGPGWVPRPEFAAEVAALAATEAWVCEWQYSPVRALLLSRAELVVWLDLPRLFVFGRLLRRTVTRRVRRVELWNGNVEPPLRTVLTDPEHLLRWAWRDHPRARERMTAVLSTPGGPTVVRLRSPREVARWLAGAVAQAGGRPF